MKIAVLGAGNGGCAAAADLTLRGFSVSLCSRRLQTLKPIIEAGGINLIDNSGERFVTLKEVTNDLQAALRNAEVILITVPAVGHDYFAEQCAPFLEENQTIVLNPGSTGGALHFFQKLKQLNATYIPPICETNTLTYVCRLVEPDKIKISLYQKNVLFAVFPGKFVDRCVKVVQNIYPNITPAENVLTTSLSNFNAIMHPSGTIMNAGWIEFTKGNFAYYYEGNTPSVCRVMEAVDRERMLIFKELNVPSLRFLDFFYRAGLTTEKGFESDSLYTAIQESEPDRFIRAPESLDNRYLHEDIGYGLVPMVQIGKIFAVETPVMRSLITLSSIAASRDYMEWGLNAKKMGIEGLNGKTLLQYLNEGKRG